jgi:hypothetical protein
MIKLVLLLFCLVSFLSFIKFEKNTAKVVFLLSGGLLFLLAAFRDGNAVRDYNNYFELYNNSSWSIEIAFKIIAWIVRYVFLDNIIFLFIIYALIGVGIKYKAIGELTPLCFLSLIIYISNFFILHELTQIRVGVAAGLLLLCIKPIYERDFRKFLFFSSCAVLFHYSALIVFPLWFLKGNKINKYIYAVIIPLAYIFYFLHINIIELSIKFIPIGYIQQRYNNYKLLQIQNIRDFGRINVFNYVFLVKCIIFYIILLKSRLVQMQNKYINILLKMQSFSLASFVFFSAMPVFAFRISELYGIVEIVTIPFIYYILKSKLLSRIIVVFIGLCLLLINIFYNKLIV